MGRSWVGLVFCLLLLLTCVSAVHTVEELWEQGERHNSELNELKQQMADVKTGFDDAISGVGMKLIVILTLEYIGLTCALFLVKLAWNWYNRVKLRKERDHYVDSLAKETELLRKKNYRLQKELTLVNESHNILLRILNEVRHEEPLRPFVQNVAIVLLFLVLSIVLILPRASASETELLPFLPAAFGVGFMLLSFRFFIEDNKRLKTQLAAAEVKRTDSLKGESEAKEEIKKPEPKPVDAETQAALDKLKRLKDGKPLDDEQASGSKPPSEPQVGGSTPPVEPQVGSLDRMAANLPAGAELKVGGGLVSLTAPITAQNQKIAEDKKVDLSDIDSALDEKPVEQPAAQNEGAKARERFENAVLDCIRASPNPITSREIATALGLTDSKAGLFVGVAMRHLNAAGQITKEIGDDGTTRWKVSEGKGG